MHGLGIFCLGLVCMNKKNELCLVSDGIKGLLMMAMLTAI